MKKLSAIAAAATLTLSVSAGATTYDLGPVSTLVPKSFSGFATPGAFLDIFTFTLPSNAGSGYSVADFTLLPVAFKTVLSTMSLVSNPDGVVGTLDDTVLKTSVIPGGDKLALSYGPTAGGPMYLVVGGITVGASGGIYTGAISAAVPEPETYAMMLAGLCAVGFMAARRKSQG